MQFQEVEAREISRYELPDFDTHSNRDASRIFHAVGEGVLLIERADGRGWMLADAWSTISDMCYVVITPLDLEPFDGNPFQGDVGDALVWATSEIQRYKQLQRARASRLEVAKRASAK